MEIISNPTPRGGAPGENVLKNIEDYYETQTSEGLPLTDIRWDQSDFEFSTKELKHAGFNVFLQVIGSFEVEATNWDEENCSVDLHFHNDMNTASFFKYIKPMGENLLIDLYYNFDYTSPKYMPNGPENYYTNDHFPKYERFQNGPIYIGVGVPIFNGGNVHQEIVIREYIF